MIFLSLVGIVLLCDLVLIVSGKKLLVHSQVERVVVYQGDIVIPATSKTVGADYSKPINSAYCTYWSGIRLVRGGGLAEGMKCPGPIL
jgi:hypothetical protein